MGVSPTRRRVLRKRANQHSHNDSIDSIFAVTTGDKKLCRCCITVFTTRPVGKIQPGTDSSLINYQCCLWVIVVSSYELAFHSL